MESRDDKENMQDFLNGVAIFESVFLLMSSFLSINKCSRKQTVTN